MDTKGVLGMVLMLVIVVAGTFIAGWLKGRMAT